MQTGQHIEAAQQFLDDASMLESAGSNMGAGEMTRIPEIMGEDNYTL